MASKKVMKYLYFVTEIYMAIFALVQDPTNMFSFLILIFKKAGEEENQINDIIAYQWFSGL